MTDVEVKRLEPSVIRRDCETAFQAIYPDADLHERLVNYAQHLIPELEALLGQAPESDRRLLSLVVSRGRERLEKDAVEWLRTPAEHAYDLAVCVRAMTTLYERPQLAGIGPATAAP